MLFSISFWIFMFNIPVLFSLSVMITNMFGLLSGFSRGGQLTTKISCSSQSLYGKWLPSQVLFFQPSKYYFSNPPHIQVVMD